MRKLAAQYHWMARWGMLSLMVSLAGIGTGCAALGTTQAEKAGQAEAQQQAVAEAREAGKQEAEKQHAADLRKAEQQIEAERERYKALQQAHQKLQESVNKRGEGQQDLEETLARLQLQLFEKQAHLNDLNKRYEQAVLEVVRAKAKLRSLESRAEAASNLAEAELAMKTLNSQTGGRDHDDTQRAEELLRLGQAEFRKENYGGALYLTGQAKVLIREGQERSMSREKLPPMSGEIAFSIPVPLRAVNGSRIRVGPGIQFKTLAALDEGVTMTGYSYKGEWVRVRTLDGQLGWVHYRQVDGR